MGYTLVIIKIRFENLTQILHLPEPYPKKLFFWVANTGPETPFLGLTKFAGCI
jgi:hypothetical protein